MDFILKTTNLCKSFGKHSAVTDVSIHVRENSVYGLLGPNGAGKSTILKMVTGMLHPTKGTIEFANHSWSRQDLMHIGALIENPPLYENLTAYENLKVRTILLGLPEQRINEVLELLLKRLGPIASRAEVKLIFESRRPVIAEVDEVKLTLALSNLVENAIKYNMKGGWVKVILDADHQYFTVEVSDSGVGIPQESIEHIYERFYRVDKSHSKEIGGTGLGLAITKSAILRHRGAITVSSEEGVGTVFRVKIPLTYIAQ